MAARLLVPVLVLGLSLFAGSASAQAVDMDRFDGRWFEIVRSPNDLQKDCRRAQIDFNPQARANRYGVVVTCVRRADGVSETLRANARVTDPGTNRDVPLHPDGAVELRRAGGADVPGCRPTPMTTAGRSCRCRTGLIGGSGIATRAPHRRCGLI